MLSDSYYYHIIRAFRSSLSCAPCFPYLSQFHRYPPILLCLSSPPSKSFFFPYLFLSSSFSSFSPPSLSSTLLAHHLSTGDSEITEALLQQHSAVLAEDLHYCTMFRTNCTDAGKLQLVCRRQDELNSPSQTLRLQTVTQTHNDNIFMDLCSAYLTSINHHSIYVLISDHDAVSFSLICVQVCLQLV